MPDGSSIELGDDFQSGDFGMFLVDELEPSYIFHGDQHPPIKGDYFEFGFNWNDDGSLREGVAEVDFNDVIYGNNQDEQGIDDPGDDEIKGFGGNDALSGGEGDDDIDGGDGDDLIGGGDGEDVIHGGAGNDVILGAAGLAVAWRVKPEEDWSDFWELQEGESVWIKGSTWVVSYDDAKKIYTVHGGTPLSQKNDGDALYAEAGDDYVVAGFGDDFIDGGAGEDQLTGHGGNDIIEAGDDDDKVDGDGTLRSDELFYNYVAVDHHGNDYIDGGDGDDQLLGKGRDDVLMGGIGDDKLWGDDAMKTDEESAADPDNTELPETAHGDDYLDGGEGDDELTGGGQNDQLYGGDGDDNLWGDDDPEKFDVEFSGQDYIDGGAGNDGLVGGGADDVLAGGDGDDLLWGDDTVDRLEPDYHGNDYLEGGDGNDSLAGAGGADILLGGDGKDVLIGDEDSLPIEAQSDDYLDGGNGNDHLTGNGGHDQLLGGSGNDELSGGDGNDTLEGGDGNDSLFELMGNNLLYGDAGNDQLIGGISYDMLSGGADNDALWGGSSSDNLSGDSGDDTLNGGDYGDYLDGGDGDDRLFGDDADLGESGSPGSDTLLGGIGNDTMAGGDYEDSLYGGDGNDLLGGDGGTDWLEGGEGNDELQGGGEADYLDGGNGDDTLFGEAGNDTLSAGLGFDSLVGGDGDDQLEGHEGNDTLFGEAGDDILSSGLGDDLLIASDGNDQLDSGDGDDTLFGEAGKDTLLGGLGSDTLLGGDDADVLYGAEDDDVLNGGIGEDSLEGGAGDDRLYGFDDADTLTDMSGDNLLVGGLGDDVLTSGDGQDSLYGEDGNDVLTSANGNDVLGGGSGDDTLLDTSGDNTLVGGFGSDSLTSGDGKDELQGDDGDDRLDAGAGNDYLFSGLGSDTLLGGTGADIYFVVPGDGVDTIIDTEDAAINDLGYAGNAIFFMGGVEIGDIHLGLGSLLINVGDNGDEVHIDGFEPNNPYASPAICTFIFADGVLSYEQLLDLGMDFTGTDAAEVITGTGIVDRINALAGDDTVYGGDAHDELNGGEGNDVLFGEQGNDKFYESSGADTLVGGIGNDQYFLTDTSDSVTEQLGEGADTIYATVDYSLASNVERLELQGHDDITGMGNAGNNELLGNDGDNRLSGLSGQDTLKGGLGDDSLDGGLSSDRLEGGNGDDSYWLDSLGDVIVELANNGSDTVNAAIDYSLGAELEHLSLIGSALIASGNKLANTLTGNAENNSLFGFDGADRLIGNEGDDSLEGGFGADTLLGGLGNDHYFAVDALDTVTEHSGQGIDTVYTTLNYSLGENLDNVVLLTDSEEAFGNVLANNLTGNDNNNTLDGGANADTMAGGAGDDDYVVDNSADVVIEAANKGYDRILSNVNFALAANVEALILTGSNDADITGNEFANLLTGNSGNNQVLGLDGDDTLNGGLGLDTLMGGLGDDVYQIERDDDVIIEAQAAGMDTVESSVTYTLVEFVENLTLTGGQDLNGGGNTLDNVLTGNQAANQLQGFAGNDTLTGLQGHDSLYGGTGDDVYVVIYAADSTVIELANEGNDTVQSAITFSLPDDVENLILTGNFSDDPWIVYTDGLGNALDNEITGNDGFNQLYGFDGQDRVDGRAGNDTLGGGDGNDWLFGGSDAVFVANNVSGYGGELLAVNADEMHGGNGNDSLDGGSDDDVLYGDADNDVLYGGDDGSSITEISNNWYGYDYRSAYVYSDGYSGYGGLIFLGNNDTLDGGAGEDKLDGGSGNDALLGGVDSDYLYGGDDGLLNTSNDDYLDGGAGIDTMLGGSGNDVYIVDGSMTVLIPTTFSECHFGSGDDDAGPSLTSISDVVIEYAGGGYDSISSSVSLTLPAHVEALYFTGSANVDVIGNDELNVIFGNAGNNRLDGGLGADTMAGGLGNDVYFVDNENDVVTEEADAGIDTVRSFLTFYSLGPEFENLDLVANAVTGIGNDADNLLRGNTQANWLEGGLGDDTLTGAGGNDSLLGGLGDDWYVFAKGFGDDTVVDDGGYDQVRFNDHLSLQDVVFSRQADDLVLTLKDSQEHMVLSQWFIGAHKIELFRFCDGTTITDDDIVASLDNHAPVAVDDNLVVQEDTLLAASMNALSNDSDPDLNDKLSLTTAATVTGLYGVWSISATGEVNYQLNNNLPTIQALSSEQQLTEQLSYQISDDNRVKPLTAEAMLSVTILGTNDVPVAETDANAVQEDLVTTASGNVLANDTDIDANAVLRVTSPELSNSTYGQLLVNAEGGYQYTLNNEQLIVQALPAWQQLDDVFDYTVSDGISSASGQLAIRVTGNNDAPVLVQPLVDQAAQVGAAWAYAVPASTFADIDTGDVLTLSAQLADGSPLPSWLAFDALTQRFTGTAPAGWSHTVTVTATDILGLTASDTFLLDITQPPLVKSALIGDSVWYDRNANGLKENDEPGIAGVTVKLLNTSGALLATTVTDALGHYEFNQLAAGNYRVQAIAPDGMSFTLANQGSNESLDSDASRTTGITDSVTLAVGGKNLDVDIGLTIPSKSCFTYTFKGCSQTDGPDGNLLSFKANGVALHASAFSQDKTTGVFSSAWLGNYSGGLGVTDKKEGSGSNSSHTVDNQGQNNFVVFEFATDVIVDKAYLSYVTADSDIKIWLGHIDQAFTNHGNLSPELLAQMSFSELNQTTLSSARWADVNKPEWLGNVLIIAADTTDTSPEDSFKIQQLKVCVSTANSVCNSVLNDASYNNTGAGIALHQDSKAVTGDLVTLLGMQAYQSDFFD